MILSTHSTDDCSSLLFHFDPPVSYTILKRQHNNLSWLTIKFDFAVGKGL